MSTTDDVTRALRRAAEGDRDALEGVVSWAYAHLERLASARLRRNFGPDLPGITLEPAALVNETFLKLLDRPLDFANRRHFFAFASRVLERVLLDYQRRRGAAKRGGGALHLTLGGVAGAGSSEVAEPSLLFGTLGELEEQDPRKAEVVRLRVLWGFEMTEIADILDISLATVERDWRFARSWLADRLERA